MSQQFVMRLFANFERGPLLTFELETLCSLLLIVLFGGIESTSIAYFLVGVSPSFCATQNSLRHP